MRNVPVGVILLIMVLALSREPESDAVIPVEVDPPYVVAVTNYAGVVDIVSRTLYAESKGEGGLGKALVATVIWERSNGDVGKFISVCLKKNAFSCWNSGALENGYGSSWDDCVSLAESMTTDMFCPVVVMFSDMSEGCPNHFYNPELASPSWAEDQPYMSTGNHRFLKL